MHSGVHAAAMKEGDPGVALSSFSSLPDRLAEVGIARLLATKGGAGAVAGHEDDVIPKGQQGLGDRLDKRPVIPTGKIGTAYAAGKEHVSHPGESFCLAEQYYVPRVWPGQK